MLFVGCFVYLSEMDFSTFLILILLAIFIGILLRAGKVGLGFADEVFDAGDHLKIRKGRSELKIALADITKFKYHLFGKSTFLFGPPTVVLEFKSETVLGDKISFIPLTSFILIGKHAIIKDLFKRIEQARGT